MITPTTTIRINPELKQKLIRRAAVESLRTGRTVTWSRMLCKIAEQSIANEQGE